MPRAYARESTRPDVMSEQTHDDCQWLKEKDGEEDVPGDRCDWNRCHGPPGIADDQRRYGRWLNDADTKNGAGNDTNKGRCRLIGLLPLR
jgi:hypothetical protein